MLRTSSLSGDRAIARNRRKRKKLNEIQETATLIRIGHQKEEPETSLEVKTPHLHYRGIDLITGWGTKIPQTAWYVPQQKK